MAIQPVTNDQGQKGFYDESIGFIGINEMQKVTDPSGVRGYYNEKSGFVPEPTSQPPSDSIDRSVPQRFASGFGRGLAGLAGGIGQRMGVYNQADIDAFKRGAEEGRQEGGTAGKVGEFAGQTAPFMLIPGGQASIMGRIGVNALAGGIAGAAQPTSQGESAVKNTAIGAAVGGAIPAALEGVKGLAQKAAPKIYESVLKPSTKIPAEQREKIVETGLEGSYAPTKGGLQKLQKDVDKVNKQIDSAITKATKTGSDIDMAEVVKRADELKAFYSKLPPDRAKPFIDEIEKIQAQYRSGGKITPEAAQEMKKTIYRLQRKHYGEMKSAEIEAEKQVARGLKDELVSRFPELKSLNEKDSALITLENAIGRAVNRSRNWDVVGLSDLAGGVIGGGLGLYQSGREGGEGGALAGMLLTRALRSPAVMSRVAFALNKAKKIPSNVNPAIGAGAANVATK